MVETSRGASQHGLSFSHRSSGCALLAREGARPSAAVIYLKLPSCIRFHHHHNRTDAAIIQHVSDLFVFVRKLSVASSSTHPSHLPPPAAALIPAAFHSFLPQTPHC